MGKGWTLPENTVAVTRGIYGNPFKLGGWFMIGDPDPRAGLFRLTYTRATEEYALKKGCFTKIGSRQEAVDMYRAYLQRFPLSVPQREFLRGKNLACDCKLKHPCHADVLLELVNK